MRLSRRGKRRLALVATALAVCAIGVAGFKIVRSIQQSRLFAAARAEGLEAHARGDLETAIEKLSYYVQHDKQDVEVLLAFGDARSKLPMNDGRHVMDAIGLYKHALGVLAEEPDLEGRAASEDEAVRRLIDLYGLAGMRFEQIEMVEHVLDRNPDDIDALSARAYARVMDRDLASALVDAQRLSVLEPDTVAWRQLELEIMRREGQDPAEMLELVDQWLDAHDGDGRYHVLKAGILGGSGRVAAARDVMRRGAERGAESLDVLEMMIAMLDELQLRELGRRVIDDALERFPDAPWVRQAMAQRLWQAGRVEEAAGVLETARRDLPTMSQGLLELEALVLVASGRRDEVPRVLEQLRQAAASGDSKAEEAAVAWSLAVHARINLDERTWADAMRRIDHAISLRPSDAALHMIRGETLAAVREHTQATGSFERAFRIDPNWTSAGITLARSLLQVGRVDEGFAVASHVLARADRTMLSPYLVYAQAYLAVLESGGNPRLSDSLTGLGRDMAAMFRDIQRQVPDRPEVAAILAEVDLRTGRSGRAMEFIESVRAQEPPSPDVLVELAAVSRRHGLALERSLLERAREVAGLTMPIAFALAELELAGGQAQRGLDLIDEAIASAEPGTANALATRQARVDYLVRMDHPTAVAELTRLAADHVGNPAVQSYVLSVPSAWQDRELIGGAIDHLREVLGERSQWARLARAQYLVRFHAEEEARLAEAIMLLNGVLEQSADSLAALTFMAEASLLGEHPSPQRAVAHLKRAIDVAPGQLGLYPRLIGLLQEQGDYHEAGQYLARLSALEVQDERLQRTELELLQRQGDFETALVRATAILADSSAETDQLVLAAMHRRAGRLDDAVTIYEQLLRRADRSPTVVAAAAAALAEAGRADEGLALLETLADTGDGTRALLLGQFHRGHGDREQARGWLERAVAAAPGSARARLALARLLIEEGDAAGGRAQALAGLRAEPDSAPLQNLLATAQLAAGDGAGPAIAVLREIDGDHGDLLALLELIGAIAGRGDAAPSPALLERATGILETHGGMAATWSLVSRLHARAGRLDTAVELARRAVGRFPGDAGVARTATELLLGAGRWNDALIEAEQWRRRSLEDALPADTTIARLLLQLGRPVDALGQIEAHGRRITARAGTDPEPFDVYLQTLLESGRLDEARSLALPWLRGDAEWVKRWTASALRLADERAAAALAVLDEADVNDAEAQLRVAAAWSQLGRRSGAPGMLVAAREWAMRASSDPEQRVDALVQLGAVAEARGDAPRAEALYREALQGAAEHLIALNNLAYLLARAGRGSEALEVARRAAAASPDQPDVLDTLAHALIAAGRIDEAERTVRRALALRPDDPSIVLTMVEALIAAERYDHAERRLHEATVLLQAARLPHRGEIERADGLRRRLDVMLSSNPGTDATSRVSEASSSDPR